MAVSGKVEKDTVYSPHSKSWHVGFCYVRSSAVIEEVMCNKKCNAGPCIQEGYPENQSCCTF